MRKKVQNWLGIGRGDVVAGVDIGPNSISMAVVRADPLRLTAVGRRSIFDVRELADEAELALTLAVDLASLADDLRLPSGTPVVVAIEPKDSTILAFDDQNRACPVNQADFGRIQSAMQRAELDLARIDLVPSALARLARLAVPEIAVVRGAYHWKIMTGLGYTEAGRSIDDGPRLCFGPDPASALPVTGLPLDVPKELASVVDPDRDAVAIGAALAAFDMPPLVSIRTEQVPSPTQPSPGLQVQADRATSVDRSSPPQPEPGDSQSARPTEQPTVQGPLKPSPNEQPTGPIPLHDQPPGQRSFETATDDLSPPRESSTNGLRLMSTPVPPSEVPAR